MQSNVRLSRYMQAKVDKEYDIAMFDLMNGFEDAFLVKERRHYRLKGEIWQSIRMRIFARDLYVCQYCRKSGVDLECDHIIPLSGGGSNEDSNLTTACAQCNRSKSAKTVEEWRLHLALKS